MDQIMRKKLAYELGKELPTIGVLGLPGIGKSETSNSIGKLLTRGVYSVDPILVEVLKNEQGVAPKAFFEKYGEEAFRKWEKDKLMNHFGIPNGVVLDFGGFGNYDIGYKEMFDKMQKNGIYTVFLNNDINVSINHLKQFNPRAVSPLTEEHGFEDWATRPGYVLEAMESYKNGGSLEEGWMKRHKKAEGRIDFIYSKASHQLDLKGVDWSVDSSAKLIIMATARKKLPNSGKYKELFNDWENEVAVNEKQDIKLVRSISNPVIIGSHLRGSKGGYSG